MPQSHHHRSPYSGIWLWKLALLFALIGGPLSYYLYQRIDSAESRSLFSLSLWVTLLGVGICVICATRNWWLRR